MTSKRKLRINIVSESEISVQGHGVHTAYQEMVDALRVRKDIDLITGEFGGLVDCDIVHIHTVGTRTWRKLFQKGPKKVVSAHLVPESFIGSLVGAKLWQGIAGWYLRWFYNKADLLVAVSPATAQQIVELGVKVPIAVIDNSIDTSKYKVTSSQLRQKIRQALGIDKDAFVVIGAGQVQPRKRVDCFIRAAKACPEMQFVWVGGMPFGALAADHNAMQAMIDKAPSNVHFPGIVPLDEMTSYYQAADVFWLPSTQETFGLVVLEGAASGLPVVLRDIPDYKETFADYALLVDDQTDVAALQKLRDSRNFRRRYVVKSAALAKRFDSKYATDQLVKKYRDLLSNKDRDDVSHS